MRSAIFAALLLVGLAASAPTSSKDKVEITKDFFPKEFSVYSSQHDIVDILVPLNNLNFNTDDDAPDSEDGTDAMIFFTEADLTNGHVNYKGLYSLNGKTVTKLLDNGRASAADSGDSTTAYFAAADGIYRYNDKTHTAEKYGTVTDSLIDIAKANTTDAIYVLNEKKELYRVTEEGTKQVRMSDVPAAEQIVLDLNDNLYYLGTDDHVYVVSASGTKKIQGLPTKATYMKLAQAPFIFEDAAAFIADDTSYLVFANGTSTVTDFVMVEKPTAYGMEALLVQYFGYNKNIYEYNVLAMVVGTALEALKEVLEENKEVIHSLATNTKTHIRA